MEEKSFYFASVNNQQQNDYFSRKVSEMFEVEHIFKSIQRKSILEDVSFSVPTGKITGLLGPNGAGKTTLIRIINQIVVPEKGFVTVKGTPINKDQLSHFGYLPEERGLFKSMTVKNHALFLGQLRGMTKRDVSNALDFWLAKFHIEAWKNKRIEELSKGMAQKVQFICTVLHDPDVLILDEPFSGFDPINIELIRNELLRWREEGKTIILSTHNMKSVQEICDRAILLNEGKLILQGDVQELRKDRKKGLYSITFSGNMIAFANALWVGYEIVTKEVISDTVFRVAVRIRRENSFNDLLQTIIPHVDIISANELLPSMEEVFIDEVKQLNQSNHA